MPFKFLVISNSGVPLFEYPSDSSKVFDINSVLFSGLLSAINNYSKDAIGQNIEEMTFQSIKITLSKDGFNNLYVVISDDNIAKEILKTIHIEVKNLFLNYLDELGIKINPERIFQVEMIDTNEKKIQAILEPLYKLWSKRLSKGNSAFKSHN